jgi:hypothetical protein
MHPFDRKRHGLVGHVFILGLLWVLPTKGYGCIGSLLGRKSGVGRGDAAPNRRSVALSRRLHDLT